jgi:hypothetical protein
MDRFTAEYDSGDQDNLPQWVVVEWFEDLDDGLTCGAKVVSFAADTSGELEAKDIAYLMNINVKDEYVYH